MSSTASLSEDTDVASAIEDSVQDAELEVLKTLFSIALALSQGVRYQHAGSGTGGHLALSITAASCRTCIRLSWCSST
jgi:N-acetylmuramic acid 6-phosphate (MurNAc-6-P) etherase